MAKRRETWAPTDHACRECGGRVVEVTNSGPTGGGNAVYKCADCGFGAAGTGPQVACWCGFSHKGQSATPYVCLPVARAASDPAAREALLRAGYLHPNPRSRPKVEIAVITTDTLRRAAEAEAARPSP